MENYEEMFKMLVGLIFYDDENEKNEQESELKLEGNEDVWKDAFEKNGGVLPLNLKDKRYMIDLSKRVDDELREYLMHDELPEGSGMKVMLTKTSLINSSLKKFIEEHCVIN